jgi:hypothetical protein
MRSKTKADDLVARLPEATAAEREALRRARRQRLDAERMRRVLDAMREPSVEELAARPITTGEPFRL